MPVAVKVVYPLYFTLSDRDEQTYKSLSKDEQREFLLGLSENYLETCSITPEIEYVEE